MGTWGHGPFDNDTAADWAGDLDEAAPADRPALISTALTGAADESDYLDADVAVEAVAAAAVVAIHQPGGEKFVSTYGPDFIEAGERIDLPTGTTALALRALERVTGDESEWLELWKESDHHSDALATIQTLRDTLQA